MDIFKNLDLLSVGVAISAIGVLGYTVYLSNRKSITNRTFLFFSLVTILWGTVNYLSYQFTSAVLTLWLFRIVMFFAIFQAFFLYQFFRVYPESNFKFSSKYKFILIPSVLVVSVITLTPLVFSDIVGDVEIGKVAIVSKGPGLFVFGLLATGLVFGGIYILLRKIRKSEIQTKKSLNTILLGSLIMFFLIIFFNFILSTLYIDPSFIPLGALFILPFVAFTSYAILKHRLFNVKVVASASLVFVLSVVSFFEVIFSTETITIIFRVSVLILVLSFGVLLIKSVLREVEQREKIEKQEKEMEIINAKLGAANKRLKELDKQKSEFIGFASHQLRSPLTAIKGYASLVLEGDYGEISEDLRHAAQIIFESANTLVTVVADYLNVSSIELGQMKYDFQVFNLMDLAKSVIEELKQNVEKKGLKLEFDCDASKTYFVKADREKIKQVLMNIIDNSAKYTPKGGVKVSLAKNSSGKILFAVKDTGIGISKNTIPKLFAKFIRAKNANETNIRGTGLGLFIAKEIITAHEGRIWVESEGEGKGSQFYVELNEEKS